jgi:hypothetical protein
MEVGLMQRVIDAKGALWISNSDGMPFNPVDELGYLPDRGGEIEALLKDYRVQGTTTEPRAQLNGNPQRYTGDYLRNTSFAYKTTSIERCPSNA